MTKGTVNYTFKLQAALGITEDLTTLTYCNCCPTICWLMYIALRVAWLVI